MAQRRSCVSLSPYQTNCSLLSRSRERSRNFLAMIRISKSGSTFVHIGDTGFQHWVHAQHLHDKQQTSGSSSNFCINNWRRSWVPIATLSILLMDFLSRSVILLVLITVNCFVALLLMVTVRRRMRPIKVFMVMLSLIGQERSQA